MGVHSYADFFNIYSHQPSISVDFASMDSTNLGSKTVFSIQSWESMNVEGQQYALFYVTLHKILEHLQILVPAGGSGTNLSADNKG